MYNIHFLPSVQRDIDDAMDWFDEQQTGLSKKFAQQLQDRLDFIQKYPLAFALRYKQTRMVKIKDFSFLIHYKVDQKRKIILVLTILHTSRSTSNWK